MASQTFLILRSRDLVVLAVRWEGFEVRPPVSAAAPPQLVATGADPTVTVTFPPQAILEQTTTQAIFSTAGLVHGDSRLTGVSELVFRLDRGTGIELSVAGVLEALAGGPRLGPTSAVEMPWGLRLAPEALTLGEAVVSDHAARPTVIADAVGLWHARLRAGDGGPADARLAVWPQLVSAGSGIADQGFFQDPPLERWREKIVNWTNETSLPPKATRLELSALGGTLSADGKWPSSAWSHELVFGRDQKVEVVAQGRLWPFGHRAIYQVFTRRAFLPVHTSTTVGQAAALLTRRILVITQPLRTGVRGRTFPFDEVEILGTAFSINSRGEPGNVELFIPENGGASFLFPIRCRTGDKDVRFDTPLVFVADMVPDPAGAASALWDQHGTVRIPGVEIDLVGADGKPGDVQEVHSLTFSGIRDGDGFRPDLKKAGVVLPALRSLLPGAEHAQERTLEYSPEFRALSAPPDAAAASSIPPVVLRFDEQSKVPVDFTENADRSGGLVAPRFTADGISRELGPVPTGVLPHQPDSASALNEAFKGATLFGFPLAALIDATSSPRPGPPKIVQRRVGAAVDMEMRWEKVRLRNHGPFRPRPGLEPAQFDLVVRSGWLPSDAQQQPTCSLKNFMLVLPPPPAASLLTLSFDSVAFTQFPGQPTKLEMHNPKVEFGRGLRLLHDLQAKLMELIGGRGPTISVSTTGLVAGYRIGLPAAAAGMFVMRNIAVRMEVHVPFAEQPVSVVLAFASREQPFTLTVSGFGGGGYVALEVAGDREPKVELSLEFGAMIALDFVVAKAEVHAFGGAHFVRCPDGSMELEAFIRIGGCVELLGLVTVSVELRVTLIYRDEPPRLFGRATLVIELDLTLYSESVTVDSGTFELVGGGAPAARSGFAAMLEEGGAGLETWESYRKAFAS
ncbi:hypothetical protein ABGB12_30075 [Actinocorallia sp. B10E7]|uniref:hypothetical protein n=1 Tax=Actinocorallia sp. B10E7 TaxID=3153558 RepID=UPI00325DDEDE